jgi:4-hydroxy-tetrahydrodipicolinate synthase
MFFGSIVALVTPMHLSGDIDYEALERLLDFHLQQGTDGIVLLGSTGEGSTVSQQEKLTIVRKVLAYIDGRIPVIVGVGTNSTATTVEYAQEICSLQPDGLLVICPYYNRPTQEGIFLHFSELNKAVSTPIIAYNHPGRTGVDLQPTTVARLAQLNNIVGLKEAVTLETRFYQLRELCPPEFLLLSGDDLTCLEFIAAGGNGVISVAANIVPNQMQLMCQAALNDDMATAKKIHAQLATLFDALNLESNPIPLKWAMAQSGLIQNALRLPLTPLSQPYHETLQAAFVATTQSE